MRLTILGGGGFRVPLVYRALLADHEPGRVTEVVLHDVDPDRLAAIGRVLAEQAAAAVDPPTVRTTGDLDEALVGADFVFSAVRVGGLRGRTVDERIALRDGVLGQETVGAGGIAYGLRTIPVARHIAARMADLAPDGWLINFTNPAGMVTEAMSARLGDRVIGICDSPVGLGRRVAHALGVDPELARFDYVGLNHLGWLRGLYVGGRNQLPRLLADRAALAAFEEGRLFGAEWLRVLGSVPNEYLHYYYFGREALVAATKAEYTRGEFLLGQQDNFYSDVLAADAGAFEAWDRTRLEREATYLAEGRAAAGSGERDAADLDGGGYERIALALMRAIARNQPTRLILNVRNRSTLRCVDEPSIVEVPCLVDGNGALPLATDQLGGAEAALVAAVKAVERLTIEAAVTGSRAAALRALASHPLVDSVNVAGRVLAGYLEKHEELAYLR
ncbi:MAG TPA: 6-phospho-beta-glucosidase [Pseudonocardiaceae bacterium]|jgi:6-phospho-beta-glucosidase|nr:6-phospho-beta-glucosidase [Pseudonocardiaceae bacterium]